MTEPNPYDLFSTAEAAEYLGLTLQGIKHHVYNSGDLVPDKTIGRTLVFYRRTLDEFNARRRKPGRPKSEPA